MISSPQTLRREMRLRRRSLTVMERHQASLDALDYFKSLVKLRHGMRIAVYIAADGELETAPFIRHATQRGCTIYAPVIHRYPRRANPYKHSAALWFAPLRAPFKRNRYGIPEPLHRPHERIAARWLDLVLTPLVAFGPQGERLGSGAGFYDQTFSFLLKRRTWKKPRLIGLAYHWQQSKEVAREAWDVPLSAIVTDRDAYRFMNASVTRA